MSENPVRTPETVRRLRDTYALKPGVPLPRRQFGGYLGLEQWYEQGG